MKLDEYQLGVKRIKVAISNPPKRAEGDFPTSREGGREDSDGFKKPSFIPSQGRWAQSHAVESDPL